MKLEYPPGSTPLDPELLETLIPKHLTTQSQLNEWEHANILSARRWAFARKRTDLVTVSFIRNLHRKMFDQSWKWAGEFRKHQTNIGIEWHQIPAQLKLLCDTIAYQASHNIFPVDELAVRFHHGLVFIHPFPNGNGRHARLMADLLSVHLGERPLTWGLTKKLASLGASSDVRTCYLKALRKADAGDFHSLLTFARS